MALSDIDRNLLQRCLAMRTNAWEDFVDRFLGLVLHVISHSAQSRSIRLSSEDREDLTSEVFLGLLANDFAVLRQFRGESSLATYLTVVARRIVVRELIKRKVPANLAETARTSDSERHRYQGEERFDDREEVEQLLKGLQGPEADIVRMYHLEGKSYREISSSTGIPENTVGPTLSRARAKLRGAAATS